MSIADLLIPDFALILLGFVLRRSSAFTADFWANLERFVYYLLFPALLFGALARAHFDFVTAAALIETGILFTVAGIVLSYAARFLFDVPAISFASAFQCAFRFNSYVGFAIMGSLHGSAGIAAFGLLTGFIVPLVNFASVWALARHGDGRLLRELIRNPLILSTFAGLAWATLELPLPKAAASTLGFLGVAALPMGLIAVGAGLRPFAFGAFKGLSAYVLAIKLIAVPATAYLVAHWLGLSGTYFSAALVLAALPTASSAYILTVQMRGDSQLVASLIALNVLVAIVTLPWWLTLIPT